MAKVSCVNRMDYPQYPVLSPSNINLKVKSGIWLCVRSFLSVPRYMKTPISFTLPDDCIFYL